MRKLLLTLTALLVTVAAPTNAQLLTVTGEYRITEVDRGGQRIGVAFRKDNPKRTQNWVYIRPDTRVNLRRSLGRGVFRDEVLNYENSWNEFRVGRPIKLHGGRGWDGTISAKKIWM